VKKILLIKTSALGDVMRTTPLLPALKGEVTWVTARDAFPLLEGLRQITHLKAIDDRREILSESFDWVINLDEDSRAVDLASRIDKNKLTGIYREGDQIAYTEAGKEWFDMSLVSRFSRQEADALKFLNRKSWQTMLFEMAGLEFSGEPYLLPISLETRPVPGLVAVETRAGERWPIKRWGGYPALMTRLEAAGRTVETLRQRDSLGEYVNDINRCETLICGDTLAMHIGLALGKRVITIFTCTSPHEIYGYGRMTKLVSPLLERFFYSREYNEEAVNCIPMEQVFKALDSREEGVSCV
jgi:heptosyltransferase II